MKLKELINYILKKTHSGKSTDICVKSFLCNFIDDSKPFQAIKIESIDHLFTMMKDADFAHVYVENNFFYFSAYYFHDDRFPVGRNYFIKESDLMKVAKLFHFLQLKGLVLPMVSYLELHEKIKLNGFEDRIKRFKTRWKNEMSIFNELSKGRMESTTVESSIFINSTGCLLCGDKDYYTVTSTINVEKSFMIGFNLCKLHLKTAQNEDSFIEYLATISKQKLPFKSLPLDIKEHIALVVEWLPKELNCYIENINNNTITLIRSSGIKVILRLDSLTNYAYMIINLAGKEVARIDSANHHNINYGPDHIHLNLSKKKNVVVPSFTTGSPLLDIKKILKIIEQEEARIK